MLPTFKIPESVLVVIHTPLCEVLLIRRVDALDAGTEFWQSVTGSKDTPSESWEDTAQREVLEETGIDCRQGSALAAGLQDWHRENVYAIYPRWAHRYAPGITHNTERVFRLQVPHTIPVSLNPREHDAWVWLPCEAAAERCFSASNAQAIVNLRSLA